MSAAPSELSGPSLSQGPAQEEAAPLRLVKFIYKNCLTFRDTEYSFQKGLTFVRGLNLDRMAGPSFENENRQEKGEGKEQEADTATGTSAGLSANGVGKSLLFTLFAALLTGDAPWAVPGDKGARSQKGFLQAPETEKTKAKEGEEESSASCFEAHVEKGGHAYIVRMFPKGRSVAYQVLQDGKDLGLHTVANQRAFIEALFGGVDAQTFYACFFVGAPFPDLMLRGTSAQRFEFLAGVFDFGFYDKVEEAAKERRKKAKDAQAVASLGLMEARNLQKLLSEMLQAEQPPDKDKEGAGEHKEGKEEAQPASVIKSLKARASKQQALLAGLEKQALQDNTRQNALRAFLKELSDFAAAFPPDCPSSLGPAIVAALWQMAAFTPAPKIQEQLTELEGQQKTTQAALERAKEEAGRAQAIEQVRQSLKCSEAALDALQSHSDFPKRFLREGPPKVAFFEADWKARLEDFPAASEKEEWRKAIQFLEGFMAAAAPTPADVAESSSQKDKEERANNKTLFRALEDALEKATVEGPAARAMLEKIAARGKDGLAVTRSRFESAKAEMEKLKALLARLRQQGSLTVQDAKEKDAASPAALCETCGQELHPQALKAKASALKAQGLALKDQGRFYKALSTAARLALIYAPPRLNQTEEEALAAQTLLKEEKARQEAQHKLWEENLRLSQEMEMRRVALKELLAQSPKEEEGEDTVSASAATTPALKVQRLEEQRRGFAARAAAVSRALSVAAARDKAGLVFPPPAAAPVEEEQPQDSQEALQTYMEGAAHREDALLAQKARVLQDAREEATHLVGVVAVAQERFRAREDALKRAAQAQEEAKALPIYEALAQAYAPKGPLRVKHALGLAEAYVAGLNYYIGFLFPQNTPPENLPFFSLESPQEAVETKSLTILCRRGGFTADIRSFSGSEQSQFQAASALTLLNILPPGKTFGAVVFDELEKGMSPMEVGCYLERFLPKALEVVPSVTVVTPQSFTDTLSRGQDLAEARLLFVRREHGLSEVLPFEKIALEGRRLGEGGDSGGRSQGQGGDKALVADSKPELELLKAQPKTKRRKNQKHSSEVA